MNTTIATTKSTTMVCAKRFTMYLNMFSPRLSLRLAPGDKGQLSDTSTGPAAKQVDFNNKNPAFHFATDPIIGLFYTDFPGKYIFIKSGGVIDVIFYCKNIFLNIQRNICNIIMGHLVNLFCQFGSALFITFLHCLTD